MTVRTERVARVRALATRLRTGPLSRLLARMAHVRPTESAFLLAAHLFLSLFPLLIIIALLAPPAADVILQVMRDRMGLHGATSQTVRELVNGAQTGEHGAITVLGLLMALISATSFTRALQRLYERSWQVPTLGLRGSWRGAIWLVGFMVYLELIFLSGKLTAGTPFEVPGSIAWITLLWWWTPYLLLGGRVRWRALVPTAMLSAVALGALGLVSARYMPYALSTNERKYGTLGVVFAIESWLVVLCGALVTCAILGAYLAQSTGPLARLARGTPDPGSWRRDPAKP